ncbi:MAG: hypothetical protein U9Q78_04830 [Chloroflexota bacterium]|nr:hypothetical protein [Chloroflexota bacterium]
MAHFPVRRTDGKERERLHRHLERFRFHSRSPSRANAQFEQLRRRWLALAATSTG